MPSQKSARPVYTRTGDNGTTGLIGNARVPKTDLRIEAFGTIDEVNSAVGLIRSFLGHDGINSTAPQGGSSEIRAQIDHELLTIQNDLFDAGSHLAVGEAEMRKHLPKLLDLAPRYEAWMDAHSSSLSELKNFILPGGGHAASFAHLARAVVRRAERATLRFVTEKDETFVIVKNLNRLGDYFFVLARRLAQIDGKAEVLWGQSTSKTESV